ncbi:MAG: hypothetical protein LH468_04800 [Nocardioides sp.]|nr:hypothetical protein [Nocardioides sp.]
METDDGPDAGSSPASVRPGRVVDTEPARLSRRTSVPATSPGQVVTADHTASASRVEVATELPDPDLPALSAATELSLQVRRRPRTLLERRGRWFAAGWLAAVAAGLACLVLTVLAIGPSYLDDVGAVVVLSAYSWALAARIGGRPVVFGAVALLAAVGVVLSEQPYLRTGAAVMMCGVAATLAVVATVPQTRFRKVAQECVLAVVISSVGALATLGFAPTISLVRFEYGTLALALLAAFAVVYRLGAGLHGLGRRGVVVVLIGAAVLVVTLLYAELLRRYGPPGLVDGLLDVVRWSRENLGAFPRPVEAVLGIPALAWGVHLRARRRQGWWVCAFGAAGTVAVANSLLNPAITIRECGLSVLYGLVVGLVVGYVAIRVDLALAGTNAGGRRAEEHAAARPEPARTSSLL